MAAPSLQTLQQLAADTGHQPGTLEKVLRLLDLLQEIANDRDLTGKLALKGGTALNVFHLDLDRLSVDIDLNYVGALDRNAMLADRPVIDAALGRILAAQGYQVRRQPTEHAGGKWIARHTSALGGPGSLEVDINYMMRQPLFGAALMNSVRLGGTQAKSVSVIDIHEIIGGKLVALLDRQAARDLFDARRIFEMPDINWPRVRAAMLAFGASGRKDFRRASVDTIGVDPKELRQKLLICLPRAMFAGERSIDGWIAESIVLCRARVAALIDWTPGEQAFLDGVIDRGVVDASGLDADADIQTRIEQMPMLNWKAEHVRKNLAGRRGD